MAQADGGNPAETCQPVDLDRPSGRSRSTERWLRPAGWCDSPGTLASAGATVRPQPERWLRPAGRRGCDEPPPTRSAAGTPPLAGGRRQVRNPVPLRGGRIVQAQASGRLAHSRHDRKELGIPDPFGSRHRRSLQNAAGVVTKPPLRCRRGKSPPETSIEPVRRHGARDRHLEATSRSATSVAWQEAAAPASRSGAAWTGVDAPDPRTTDPRVGRDGVRSEPDRPPRVFGPWPDGSGRGAERSPTGPRTHLEAQNGVLRDPRTPHEEPKRTRPSPRSHQEEQKVVLRDPRTHHEAR